eukprot:7970561-Pyramimonas_sp.AAC.1
MKRREWAGGGCASSALFKKRIQHKRAGKRTTERTQCPLDVCGAEGAAVFRFGNCGGEGRREGQGLSGGGRGGGKMSLLEEAEEVA